MIRFAKSAATAVIAVVCVGPAWGASSITRTSSFTYDAQGVLKQEVVEPDNSAFRLQTDYNYDTYGNKVSVTVSGADIVSRSSTSTFDAKGQFNASNTNALGQKENLIYDARFALPTSHTGPNGLATKWTYDTFGRKTQETRADGTLTKWSYLFCSGVNGGSFTATASCVSGAKYVVTETPYAAGGTTANGPSVSVFYDALDREISRQTQGFNGATVRADQVYNALGRMEKTSRPYLVSGGTPQYTSFLYDALGRVIRETTPDGSVSQIAYAGLIVTETNALGQTRTETKNSQGKVVSIKDALNGVMTFTYDAVGNVLTTRDAAGNVVSATYDQRGRKITSSDPDLGYWTYSYNVLDQAVRQVDAKGQVTTLTYDRLDRMVQRTEPTATSQWTYDTGAYGIGKLASSAITAGAGNGFNRSVSYDSLGRPIQVATKIDGTTYRMGATYDANSRLSTVSYPSGFTARYGYNSLGYANQLIDAATGKVQWTANAMDADGHLTQMTSGNGLVTNRAFQATTGRLTNINTGVGSGSTVQSFAYTYDRLGNPLSRTDANSSLSETFTYDALNRLTSSKVNLDLTKTFSYNAIGNILSKTDIGTYTYPAAGQPRPHAVTSVEGNSFKTTFTYDVNGNQTSAAKQAVASFGGRQSDQTIEARSISYTSYNKPASITQGSRTISFVDDTEHQRFKQVTPEGTTLYIAAFGVMAELTGSTKWTDYLAVGSEKVGMRVLAATTVTTRYFHTDHLGSISVITNENGVVVERLSYDAWGQRRNPNGTVNTTGSITSQTTRGFTGHEHLSAASLVHMNGRVYDPLLGRFTSADPTVPGPSNMQAWNRYSYVYNDPLTFTDPNGFGFWSSLWHKVIRPIVGIVVSVVVYVYCTPCMAYGAAAQAAIAGAAGGMAGAAANGANLSQTLRAGVVGGLSAYAMYGVGEWTNSIAGLPEGAAHFVPGLDTPGAYAFNMAGHALVGCAGSAAFGGSCQSGALAGAVGSALAPLTNQMFPNARTDIGQRIGGTITSAVAGGLASAAGGGKFGNGAYTAAFGYLFNQVARVDKLRAELDKQLDEAKNAYDQVKAAGTPEQQASAAFHDILRQPYSGGIIQGSLYAFFSIAVAQNEMTVPYDVEMMSQGGEAPSDGAAKLFAAGVSNSVAASLVSTAVFFKANFERIGAQFRYVNAVSNANRNLCAEFGCYGGK